MKKLLSAFFIAMAMIIAPHIPAQAGGFAEACNSAGQYLEKACLPIAGRMVKDQSAACHCPPQSMCPAANNKQEWRNPTKLSLELMNFCCTKPPNLCSFEKTTTVSCNAPTGLEEANVEYCYKYAPICNDNSTECSIFTGRLSYINEALATLRADIIALSLKSPVSAEDFDAGIAKMALINEQKAKAEILKADVEAFNKNNKNSNYKLECANEGQAKDTYCTHRVQGPCPNPNDCNKNRGDIDPVHHFITPEGVFNDKNPDALAYEDSVKDKCPVVSWQDCIAEGSMITMADGSKRKIQEIRIGEFVKGYNANNKVTGLSLEDYAPNKLFTINSDELHITGGHPILTTAGWKAIHPEDVNTGEAFGKQITKLMVGDEIIIADEATLKVKSLNDYKGAKVATYNLAVDGDFTYIANGIVIRAYKNSTRY